MVRSFLAGTRVEREAGRMVLRWSRLPEKVALSWWRWEELNLRHGAYETPALPLSYTAVT